MESKSIIQTCHCCYISFDIVNLHQETGGEFPSTELTFWHGWNSRLGNVAFEQQECRLLLNTTNLAVLLSTPSLHQ